MSPEDLRSYRWFGPQTLRAFGHRSRMKQIGFRQEDFTGRPVIAIINIVHRIILILVSFATGVALVRGRVSFLFPIVNADSNICRLRSRSPDSTERRWM